MSQLLQELHAYTVVERDGSVIACAALFPYLEEKSGEVAAFAVSPECRGHGRGDSLLGTTLSLYYTCTSRLLLVVNT